MEVLFYMRPGVERLMSNIQYSMSNVQYPNQLSKLWSRHLEILIKNVTLSTKPTPIFQVRSFRPDHLKLLLSTSTVFGPNLNILFHYFYFSFRRIQFFSNDRTWQEHIKFISPSFPNVRNCQWHFYSRNTINMKNRHD